MRPLPTVSLARFSVSSDYRSASGMPEVNAPPWPSAIAPKLPAHVVPKERSSYHCQAERSCTIAQRGGLFPAAANALSLDRLETVEASLLRKTTARTAMRNTRRFPVVGVLIVLMMICFGTSPATAQSRAHVYLLRGLMNIFSLGMDSLAVEIQHYGIYATVHNHGEWQTLADQATVGLCKLSPRCKPIDVIHRFASKGHSSFVFGKVPNPIPLGRRRLRSAQVSDAFKEQA